MAMNIPHTLYDAVKEGIKIGKTRASTQKKFELSVRGLLLEPELHQRLSGPAQKRLSDTIRHLRSRQRMMAECRGPKYFRVVKTFSIEATERFFDDRLVCGISQIIKYTAPRHLTLWPQEINTGEEPLELFLHGWVDPNDWIIRDAKLIAALREHCLQETALNA